MQPYSDQTIWNMEDSLKRFENAKWPQKNWKWKTTSKMFKMEDDIKNLKMEDDFKKIVNGRRPQKIIKWKTTSKFLKRENENGKMKMEDDLKKVWNSRWPIFFLNEDDL